MTDRKRYVIVLDTYGNPWGPFESGEEAALWAKKKWPDQDQDELHDEHLCEQGVPAGWELRAVRGPDE
jgi:hypothetical protein